VGLDVPNLDDRAYAEIIEAARRRIPVHAPEWTDHNAHDPGITILETLAWLAESYAYQLDRVTDTHREQYLRLLGAAPAGPRRATASLGATVTAPRTVAAAEPLAAVVGPDRTERFETARETALTDASVVRVVSEHRRGRTDHTGANRTDGIHFLAFGESAAAGSAMYVGFDGDPFGTGGNGPNDTLDLMLDLYEADLPEPASHGGESPSFEPSVDLRWQYCENYERWFQPGSWSDLAVREDGTDRLYRSGTVRFERPATWDPEAWGVRDEGVLDAEPGIHWIRAVVRATEVDPDDPDGDGRPGPGYEVPPRLSALRLNVVEARHGERVTDPVTLHRADSPGETRTDASPGQRFRFPSRPVRTGGPRPVRAEGLIVVLAPDAEDPGAGTEWTRVDSFAASGPDDRHYVLEEATGTVTFGDGARGTVPEPGVEVVATEHAYGGGTAGNVPASTDWRFESAALRDVVLLPDGPASGGRAAESVDDALDRLRADLGRRYRAVTAADYESVALDTPGVRFGRAHAWVEGRPAVGDCAGGREVRVVVVPYGTRVRPEPSAGVLEAVRRHLCEHRLLTDRVRVDPPSYVGVGVDVEVGVRADVSPTDREEVVEAALDAFLDPLDGFEGTGWPFGRPVYPSELYEVVEAVEGVDCVVDISVTATGTDVSIDTDGTVRIAPAALVYPTDHDVTVRSARDACGGGV
jgi:predicted phage baseplate assembly protein